MHHKRFAKSPVGLETYDPAMIIGWGGLSPLKVGHDVRHNHHGGVMAGSSGYS